MMNPDTFEAICAHIETTGDGVLKTCTQMHVSPKCFYEFRDSSDEAGKRYARAKEIQADAIVEECIAISDDTTNDDIVDKDGNEHPNSEWISRSRLKVDTRKWLAAKLRPKKYGDKVDVTSGNERIKSNPFVIMCSDPNTAKGLERMAHGEQPAPAGTDKNI